MSIGAGILGWIVGLFLLAQIIYPILFSIPTARKLQSRGVLKRPIPMAYILAAPVVGTIILGGALFVVRTWFSDHLLAFTVGLVVAGLILLVQLPLKNADLYSDFFAPYRGFIEGGAGDAPAA